MDVVEMILSLEHNICIFIVGVLAIQIQVIAGLVELLLAQPVA
jgi:hypothetical protein